MTLPKTHNNYVLLRRQLRADAVRRVAAFIASDPVFSKIDPDDLDAYGPKLDFGGDNVWNGTCRAPEWAAVDVQDGGWSFSVIYDWTQSTVVVKSV